MNETVMIQIPVSPAAAAVLRSSERKEQIGRLISGLVRPVSPAEDPLAALIAEIKVEARAGGLSDAAIDSELAAYNAKDRF